MKIPADIELLINSKFLSLVYSDSIPAYISGFLTGIVLSRKLLKLYETGEHMNYFHSIAAATFMGDMRNFSGMQVDTFCRKVSKATDGNITIALDQVVGPQFMLGNNGSAYARGLEDSIQYFRFEGYDYFSALYSRNVLWHNLYAWVDQVEEKVKTYLLSLDT